MKNEPIISSGCVSNIYVKVLQFKNKGDIEIYPKNDFDHVALVSYGSIRIQMQEVFATFEAPHLILLKKDLKYKIEALESETIVACIQAIRDPETGEIKDPDSIKDQENPFGVPHWRF